MTGFRFDKASSGSGKSCSRCGKSCLLCGNSRRSQEKTWRRLGVSCLLIEMTGCRSRIPWCSFRMVWRRMRRSSVVSGMHGCGTRIGSVGSWRTQRGFGTSSVDAGKVECRCSQTSVDVGSSRRDCGISWVGFRSDHRRADLPRGVTGNTWSVLSHSWSRARSSRCGGGSNRRGFRSSSVRRRARRCLRSDSGGDVAPGSARGRLRGHAPASLVRRSRRIRARTRGAQADPVDPSASRRAAAWRLPRGTAGVVRRPPTGRAACAR
jgi:hypothetical protein